MKAKRQISNPACFSTRRSLLDQKQRKEFFLSPLTIPKKLAILDKVSSESETAEPRKSNSLKAKSK
ncbi:MAG: hypothetical protein N2235_23855, partial [Fischerella sp.]|nr:hypothetical protein [Fischerella sp.]